MARYLGEGLNKYFHTIAKKNCPNCGAKKTEVWGWYEYVRVRKSLVTHFCRNCFEVKVASPILGQISNAAITLIGYQGALFSRELTDLQVRIRTMEAIWNEGHEFNKKERNRFSGKKQEST